MNREEIVVSVIIPAYNAEKYIAFCLDSIISQTHKNLEIIVVDDGSTDNTGKICDEYSAKDSRIKVIHQKNKGLSGARNAALDIMSGEYVTFVDSDDFISADYTKRLLELCIENNSQISACHAFDVSNHKIIQPDINHSEQTVSALKLLENTFILQPYYDTVISKLFHNSIFREIRFPVGIIHEDSYIIFDLIEKSQNITFTTEHLYYYYLSPNSIMRSDFSVKRFDMLLSYEKKLEVLERNNCVKSINMLYRSYLYTVAQMIGQTKYCDDFSPTFKKEKIKELRKKYKELKKANKDNPYFKGKYKLISDLLYRFPFVKKNH